VRVVGLRQEEGMLEWMFEGLVCGIEEGGLLRLVVGGEWVKDWRPRSCLTLSLL
jgi:hypothetical protein